MTEKLYAELAPWWPLISDPADYADEAEFWRHALRDALGPGRHHLLEFGVGGGHHLSHLVGEFDATAVDLSDAMLAHSRRLNPSVTHHIGDMRSIALGRTFDAVLIHDAVCYLTTPADIAATVKNAAAHLRPGGIVVMAPDYVRENFPADGSESSISPPKRSADGAVEVVYAEYVYDPDPADCTYEGRIVVWLRHLPSDLRIIDDHHVCGLFSLDEWHHHLAGAGFRPALRDYPVYPDGRPAWLITGIKP